MRAPTKWLERPLHPSVLRRWRLLEGTMYGIDREWKLYTHRLIYYREGTEDCSDVRAAWSKPTDQSKRRVEFSILGDDISTSHRPVRKYWH